MSRNKKIIFYSMGIIGAIIIIVGLFSAVTPLSNFFEIIEIEEDAYNNAFNSSETKKFTLNSGKYDVYYYSDINEKPGLITIKNSDGEDAYSENQLFSSGNFEIGNRNYRNIGTLTADKDGEYTVYLEKSGVIMFIEQGYFLGNIFSILTYIGLIIIGAILLAVSIIVIMLGHFANNKKNKKI